MTSVAACIPAKGRIPLLRQTIRRLKWINRIDHVIVAGHEKEVQELCFVEEADFVYHPNNPLGQKWNASFEFALKNYDADAYLFVGSSDWVHNDYLDVALPLVEQYDLIGKPDFYLYDIGEKEGRLCHWKGYEGNRQGEPIGIGRVLSKRIMHKMEGRPFADWLESSLDYNMLQHVLVYSGKIKLIEDKLLKTLSLSHYAWSNKHSFTDHWTGRLPSEQIEHATEWMKKYFPEFEKVVL